ncbi:MAG: hypothetical protein RL367_310 [Pseudomonadota bacterium]
MSIHLITAAWDLPMASTEKFVLISLCDHADDRGLCWPSVARISAKVSRCERSVQGALKWLGEQGYFTTRDGLRPSRTYQLNTRKICAPQPVHPTPAAAAPPPRSSCTQTVIEPSVNLKREKRAGANELSGIGEDWQPDGFAQSHVCHAITAGLSAGEHAVRVTHFIAHHRKTGQACADWQAAWVTWLLTGHKREHGRAAPVIANTSPEAQAERWTAIVLQYRQRGMDDLAALAEKRLAALAVNTAGADPALA